MVNEEVGFGSLQQAQCFLVCHKNAVWVQLQDAAGAGGGHGAGHGVLDSPRPSTSYAPSHWLAAVATPHKKPSSISYGHPHFFLIMGRAHWNSCTSRIAEKSQMQKRILGLLCAKKTKQRPLRRPRRFRGRCHCGSGNAAGISLQTDNAWPCAGVPHFLRWAP